MCLGMPSAPKAPPPPPPLPEPTKDVVSPRTGDTATRRRRLSGAAGQNRTILGDSLVSEGDSSSSLLGS